MDDLSSLLCSEAIHLEAKHKKVTEPIVGFFSVKGSANFASRTPTFTYSRERSSYRGNRGGRNLGSYRGNGRYYNNNKGRGGNFNRVYSNPGCQIYGGLGHSALDCWHRMDP